MENRWLLKTEPGEYSFDDLVREREAVWSGVTNALALKYLRSIRKGEELLIYHSGKERAIVGLAKAASVPYPDPKLHNPRMVVVDVVPVRKLKQAVSLDAIKSSRGFKDFELVRLPRLSVMPVPDLAWNAILRMAG